MQAAILIERRSPAKGGSRCANIQSPMRRVAFTSFRKPGGKKSRYQVPLDQLPKDAEAVGELTWRDLPETDAEYPGTSFLQTRECPFPPAWSGAPPKRG
jgi:hypothetical protein